MLIPNFSIRALLVLTGAAAVVALFIHLALRGEYWAGGIAAAVVAALIALLLYAAVFCVFEILGPPSQRKPTIVEGVRPKASEIEIPETDARA